MPRVHILCVTALDCRADKALEECNQNQPVEWFHTQKQRGPAQQQQQLPSAGTALGRVTAALPLAATIMRWALPGRNLPMWVLQAAVAAATQFCH